MLNKTKISSSLSGFRMKDVELFQEDK